MAAEPVSPQSTATARPDEAPTPLRYDLQIIADWIRPGSRVLDLGCGNGELLQELIRSRQVIGTGIESSEAKVAACIDKGLSVLQGDINEEIEDYADQAFDYVILSQTLQQVYAPDRLIRALLRIGSKAVVSFPNFSHLACRLQLFFGGFAPKTPQLPYEWYNTPNIRPITIKDFHSFCRQIRIRVLKEVAINTDSEDRQGKIVRHLPNLLATYGIFLLAKEHSHE